MYYDAPYIEQRGYIMGRPVPDLASKGKREGLEKTPAEVRAIIKKIDKQYQDLMNNWNDPVYARIDRLDKKFELISYENGYVNALEELTKKK